MKVSRPSGPSSVSSGSRAAPASGGFSLPETGPASSTSATTAASGVTGVADVSALMALQGIESATERRRRAIRRGGGLLDRLEDLKIALLSGETGEAALQSLSRAIAEARPDKQAPDLDAVLDQIDLRAAVELAKAEATRSVG